MVKDVKSKEAGQIEPVPEFPKQKKMNYQAHNLRSPFDKSKPKALTDAPDKDRPKEPLESFPLDGLKMVGTLNRDNKIWALVKASNGKNLQCCCRLVYGKELW